METVDFRPVLPSPEMSVDVCVAYRITGVTHAPEHLFSFDLLLNDCPCDGSRCSGQFLDAQEWLLGEACLVIGTEDVEAQQERLRWLPAPSAQASAVASPVEYLKNGFRINYDYIPSSSIVAFHFIIAYNECSRGDEAEWFAADIPYAKIENLPVVEHLAGPKP